MKRPGDMKCRVCGWWPPMLRERKGRAVPASESWRWRALREHIYDVAEDEFYRGPHMPLVDEMERR